MNSKTFSLFWAHNSFSSQNQISTQKSDSDPFILEAFKIIKKILSRSNGEPARRQSIERKHKKGKRIKEKRPRMRPLNFSCDSDFPTLRWRLHAVMDFLLLFSVLFFLLRLTFADQNQSIKPSYEKIFNYSSSAWTMPNNWYGRFKRSSLQKITECIFVTSEENYYFHKSESPTHEVCGIYLFTDPDKVVEIYVDYVDVPCSNGGLVTFFDGWELNGKFFPGVDDHEKPFLQRYKEFCGVEKAKKAFVTTQNAGMLHYRIPTKGRGFSFYVKFSKNTAPCNILVESKDHIYTLRNYGKANNCTALAVFPAKIKVLAFEVAVSTNAEEIDAVYQWGDKKMSDQLQIGGSEDFDSSRFVLFKEVCGLDSFRGMDALVVGCEVAVVRLVSSGRFENSATLSISQPDQDELFRTNFVCEV